MPTITEQMTDLIAREEARYRDDPGRYHGFDWWQLAPDEEVVFAIDPARWPRMMMAIAAYDALAGGADPGADLEFDAAETEAFRAAAETSGAIGVAAFQEFAAEYAGLSFREAAAAHAKNKFWLTRAGILRFTDEG